MAVDPEIQEATNFAIAMARLPARPPGSQMSSLWPWRVLRLAAALSLRTAEGYRPLDWVESLVNSMAAARRARSGAGFLHGLRSSSTFDPVGGSSNGRTADSDSASLGSNPSPPANGIQALFLDLYSE